jgi:hypothetical protein
MPISLGKQFTTELCNQYDENSRGKKKGRKRIAPPGPQLMKIFEINYHVAGDNNKANHDFITILWINAVGQTCDDFVSLSPTALWKLASRMQAVNLTVSMPENIYITAFLGRYAEVVVEHDENGNFIDAKALYVNRPEKLYDNEEPVDVSLKQNEYTKIKGAPEEKPQPKADDLPF